MRGKPFPFRPTLHQSSRGCQELPAFTEGRAIVVDGAVFTHEMMQPVGKQALGTGSHAPKRQGIDDGDDDWWERIVFLLDVIANAVFGMVADESQVDVRKADTHRPFQKWMFEPSVRRESQLASLSVN